MIRICCADISDITQDAYQRLYAQASEDRKRRADRYRRQEDAQRCIVADALVRYAARSAFGSEQIAVERTPEGKPYWKDREDCHFSLSHSGRWVAIAWGSSPVGIDVEQYRTDGNIEGIAKRFFCPDEQAYLSCTEGEERNRCFFAIWTKKESYLKYLGTGLAHPLDAFSVLQPRTLGVTFVETSLEGAALAVCTEDPQCSFCQLSLNQL